MTTRLHLLDHDPTAIPRDFWESSHCEIMVMGHWAAQYPQDTLWLQANLPSLPSHVWLASSGTLAMNGSTQWIAISKDALLCNAASVNRYLEVSTSDSWGLALPLAHVGGLGIMARTHLLGQKVQRLTAERWDPQSVASGSWSGQWISLVPTQLHDLVVKRVKPPETLRAAIIGGDRLSPTLWQEAQQLGWPLCISYGLTEGGSQIATSAVNHLQLKSLDHATLRVDEEQRLWLSSQALFTGKAVINNQQLDWQERPPGAWASQDRATLSAEGPVILGRIDSVIKVKGEKIDLGELEKKINLTFGVEIILVALPHSRLGMQLHLASERPLDLAAINADLLPHQRIAQTHQLIFPRTTLGKIKRGEIREALQMVTETHL